MANSLNCGFLLYSFFFSVFVKFAVVSNVGAIARGKDAEKMLIWITSFHVNADLNVVVGVFQCNARNAHPYTRIKDCFMYPRQSGFTSILLVYLILLVAYIFRIPAPSIPWNENANMHKVDTTFRAHVKHVVVVVVF